MPNADDVWRSSAIDHEVTQCIICPGNPVYKKGRNAWYHFFINHRDRGEPIERDMMNKYGLPPEGYIETPEVVMGRLARSLIVPLGGNADAKHEFRLAAGQALKKLAQLMQLDHGAYDIRWNEGGPAVSGEATLHHSRFYLQVEQSLGSPSMEVLYRTCRNMQDYSGGDNHFCPALVLDEPHRMAQLIERLLGGPVNATPAEQRANKIVDRGNGPGED